MKQNYHQGGYHSNKLHGLKMFFSSFHWPTLHSITQVVPMFKVDQSKDWRLKCKQSRTSQASCSVPFSSRLRKHRIYYTSPYLLLLFLLLLPLEGSLESTLRLIVRGGGRGVAIISEEVYVRVITLGVERSCSKLELKTAIMATLNTLKHEHCRL